MLIGPAHTHRYRRFADALTGAHARLAEKRGWLVLRFSGLSPPILCQLAWRTVPFSLPALRSPGGTPADTAAAFLPSWIPPYSPYFGCVHESGSTPFATGW